MTVALPVSPSNGFSFVAVCSLQLFMFGDLKPKSLAHCNLRPDAAHVAEAVLGTALDESSVRLMEREV